MSGRVVPFLARPRPIRLPNVPPPVSTARSWWALLRAPIFVLAVFFFGVAVGALFFGGAL